MRVVRRLWVMMLAAQCSLAMAQMPAGERVDTDLALDRALKTSSLTFEGKPFHAVMTISGPTAEYSGRVEVWWVDAGKYRVKIASPKFSQEKIANAGHISEKNEGDYYPRWLENFVLAILDPVPMQKNFRGLGGAVMVGSSITNSCIRRDDRPGGITDQITWGDKYFTGSEPRLDSVQTTNVSLSFKDWKGFGKKQVARTITTDVLDYKTVTGQVTLLEELKSSDDAMFAVASETPATERIATEYVSTLKEESMVEQAPSIEWPTVREGKTDGYMIVYARTDRTGQVRETAKHNSDQPGLESFGMEQALRYKFKPLIVDGVARQMEMPLVLHFSAKLADPLPVLSWEQMKGQIYGCPMKEVSAGTQVTMTRASVNEEGKLTGEGGFQHGTTPSKMTVVMGPLFNCKFKPYSVNGHVTYYHGDVIVKPTPLPIP